MNALEGFGVFGLLVIVYLALQLLVKLVTTVRTYYNLPCIAFEEYGKWSVVTGASDGIGKQYAIQLAERGQNVVLLGRTESKLRSVAQHIESSFGVEVKLLAVDFSHGDEVYEKVFKLLEGLDIGTLVNNVGVGTPICKFADIPNLSQVIRDVVEVNVVALLKMTQIILPMMAKNQRGLVINISSGSASIPLPMLSVYGASKTFVDYFSRCISHEYENDGIKIVSIIPYFVSTRLTLNAKPGFWLRSTKDYVRTSFAAVATSRRWSHGCWQHDLQGWIGRNLPHRLYVLFISLVLVKIAKKQV